ncbi:molybdate ABC transporter substrate-binding protein [Endozoicomonas sp. (ex Bugula neritina AB1)]|nr:molybdate ABC transporter substrate-binding protein [Endozoicomonas sp. (ex Bugula neritina AB1)]
MMVRLCAFIMMFVSLSAQADQIRVAVAANFKPILQTLSEQFEKDTEHQVTVSSASTGVLYNQVVNGAPFDLFLSADSRRPQQLDDQGLVVKGSRTTYGYGELVLWHNGNGRISLKDLKTYKGRLAIANPVTAPYGLAAQQVLEKMSLWQGYQGRLIQGASIQQTWQFVASGNVELGLVARSQMINPSYKEADITLIPADQYDPIQQDLVILKRSKSLSAAQEFRTFLLSPASQNYIASQGYLPAEVNH